MQSGVRFFPLDTSCDTKLALLECEYGLKGFAVIIKLWQKIYGGEGYYIEWNKDVALLFAREVGLSYEAVSEIINAAIRRDLFSSDLAARYGILTSAGIQKRYMEATVRRKEVILKKEYLLIRVEQNQKNVCITEGNVYIHKENAYIFNQINKEINKYDDDAQTAKEVYISLFGSCTEMVAAELAGIERQIPLQVIAYILQLAKTDGKKWNWTKTVLRNAVKDGIQSVEGFERVREQHAIKKRAGVKNETKAATNRFINYTQTATYDFAEIERRAVEKRLREYGEE